MTIIKTQQQYLRSQGYLEKIRRQLLSVEKRCAADRDLLEVEQAPLQRMIADVQRQLADYEQAKDGRVAAELHTLDRSSGKVDVGGALLKLRLAGDMTQEELARRVGSHQPNVNRWESPGCQSYTLAELQKLAAALGCMVDIVFVAKAPIAAAQPISPSNATPKRKPGRSPAVAHRGRIKA